MAWVNTFVTFCHVHASYFLSFKQHQKQHKSRFMLKLCDGISVFRPFQVWKPCDWGDWINPKEQKKTKSTWVSILTDLTEPFGPHGTCKVMGMGMALSARRVAMALCASASFRGALTHVQPRYDSLLNWTLSSSRMDGLHGTGGASVDNQEEVFEDPKKKKNLYTYQVYILK